MDVSENRWPVGVAGFPGRRKKIRRHILFWTMAAILSDCAGFGATRLYEDHLEFSRALGEAEKCETLLNIVRIRYGEAPMFLQSTQVISGYQLQRNITGGFEARATSSAAALRRSSSKARRSRFNLSRASSLPTASCDLSAPHRGHSFGCERAVPGLRDGSIRTDLVLDRRERLRQQAGLLGPSGAPGHGANERAARRGPHDSYALTSAGGAPLKPDPRCRYRLGA